MNNFVTLHIKTLPIGNVSLKHIMPPDLVWMA